MNEQAPFEQADGTGSQRGLSRRGLMLGGGLSAVSAAAVLALAAPSAALAATAPAAAPAATHPTLPDAWKLTDRRFIGTRHGAFANDGEPWRFGGTNTYYLHTSSHYMIDSALDNAHQLGLAVVRAWAFSDGAAGGQSVVLQPKPFSYDEAAFDSLDYAVYKAGQLGIRLVLTLTNNWGDYGGMPQYVQWFHPGAPDDEYGAAAAQATDRHFPEAAGNTKYHDLFYTDQKIRAAYFAYVKHVLTRKNRYTGLAYRDDPTVMTWELANEPRNRSAGSGFDNTGGAPLLKWADAASQYIKTLAPHQLVALGDEGLGLDFSSSDYPYGGYEGNDWIKLTSLPAIDYGTVHLYPVGWGEAGSSGTDYATAVAWGATWITDHLAAAARIGKPFVVEEFGLPAADTNRDADYQSWMSVFENGGPGANFQFWLLTALQDDGTDYGDYDGYRVTYPSSTANILAAGAAALATP